MGAGAEIRIKGLRVVNEPESDQQTLINDRQQDSTVRELRISESREQRALQLISDKSQREDQTKADDPAHYL